MSKAIMKKGMGLKLLALAAVVAAVAFSGVLFTSRTADAQAATDVTLAASGNTAVSPGALLAITATSSEIANLASGDYTDWTITTTGAASATFVASGAGTLTCQDSQPRTSACDASGTAATIHVHVKIADDSGAGAVLVRATRFGGAVTDAGQVVLTINPALTATSITIMPSATSIAAAGGTSTLEVTVKNSLGGGVATVVDLVTTSGQISSCQNNAGTDTTGQACQVTTVLTPNDAATDGQPSTQPVLTALASPGVATVTATVRGTAVSTTAEITFFGAATNIDVAADQDALQVGGSTFVVVTVTDAAGSPVTNHELEAGDVMITGPMIPSVALTQALNVPKEVGAPVDGMLNALLGDLPHCANGTAPYGPVADGVNYRLVGETTDLDGGTNAAGKCVLQVTAPVNETNPAANATRGAHTVKVILSATESAEVSINVGGPVSSIESDAPASINPSDEITVNVTVLDDEGVGVGAVAIEVDQTAGDGKIITDVVSPTMSGRASFTYLAPSRPGTAEFLVRTRDALGAVTASLPIIVTIGDPAPEAPDAIAMTLAAGGHYYAVPAGASTTAADLFGRSVNSAWKYNASTGAWSGYDGSSGRGGFMVNAGDVLYVVSDIDQTVGG